MSPVTANPLAWESANCRFAVVVSYFAVLRSSRILMKTPLKVPVGSVTVGTVLFSLIHAANGNNKKNRNKRLNCFILQIIEALREVLIHPAMIIRASGQHHAAIDLTTLRRYLAKRYRKVK